MKTFYCFDFTGDLLFSGTMKSILAKTGIEKTQLIYRAIHRKSIVWSKYYFSDKPKFNINKAKYTHNPLYKVEIDQAKYRYDNSKRSIQHIEQEYENRKLDIKGIICLMAADVQIKLLMNKDQVTYKKKLYSKEEIIKQLQKTTILLSEVMIKQGFDINKPFEFEAIPTI